MAISLISSTPAHGSTDFHINRSIELEFNKAISSSSLTKNVISLTDLDTGEVVPVSLSLNPTNSAVVFLMTDYHLKENTTFRLLVVGTDKSLGYSLVAQDSDTLDDTVRIEFSTGDSVFDIDTTLEKQASTLTQEGDLFLPTNVEALGYEFTIEHVRPRNHKHGVPTTLNGDNQVAFKFSKNLKTGEPSYDTWAEVNAYPLISEYYLATGETLNKDSGNISIPDYGIDVSGEYLNVSFSGELPKNVGIDIELNSDIISVDGDQYGGEMRYIVNTTIYPNLVPTEIVRREVQSINVDFWDDYIGTMILKNSIGMLEMNLGGTDHNKHKFAKYNFILYATVIDLIEDKDLHKFVLAGTRRQLGDLNTSVDSLSGRVALKLARAEKMKQGAIDTLMPGWQINTGSYDSLNSIRSTMNRLWYDISGRYTRPEFKYKQDNVPLSNSPLNRRAKTNNPWI